jgi:SAM-dependent methyltransferase
VSKSDVDVNRDVWALVNAQFTDAEAERRWLQAVITWGLFCVPESSLNALGDPSGLDVLDLGCGSGYFSGWLSRRGAHPVGLDVTPAQLTTAQRCQSKFGQSFPLVEADGERPPFRDASFDLILSEYGASVWCDPQRWLSEAARVLRPGGRLVFLTNSVLVRLCVPKDAGTASTELQRPQRGASRVRWPGGGIEHHPSHGDWIGLLGDAGFSVIALHELYAEATSDIPEYYDIATPDWASRWPVEDLWVAQLSKPM